MSPFTRFAFPALASAALCLAGCATPAYTNIAPQQMVQVMDGISVSPQLQWGQATMSGFKGTLWTIDGAGLDSLMFFLGYPGHPLIDSESKKGDTHVYQASMLPDDVMELLAANFEQAGFRQVKTSHLRPAPFGNATGFRFDIAYTTSMGLEVKGMAIACQRNGRLDMILFIAPAEYYFGHYAPAVEKLFASVQVTG